jgi:hypothetical protein
VNTQIIPTVLRLFCVFAIFSNGANAEFDLSRRARRNSKDG